MSIQINPDDDIDTIAEAIIDAVYVATQKIDRYTALDVHEAIAHKLAQEVTADREFYALRERNARPYGGN